MTTEWKQAYSLTLEEQEIALDLLREALPLAVSALAMTSPFNQWAFWHTVDRACAILDDKCDEQGEPIGDLLNFLTDSENPCPSPFEWLVERLRDNRRASK